MSASISHRSLLFTLGGLLLLTASSYGLSFVPLGTLEIPIGLAIALFKASLVMIFFMHMLRAGAPTILAALSGIVFLLILALFVAGEVATRTAPPLRPPIVPMSQ